MRKTGLATVLIAAGAVLLLTAGSLLALALFAGPHPGVGTAGTPACTVPTLPGTTVHVSETDGGGRMMGSPVMRRGMRLVADTASVPRGRVSFAVANRGTVPHELLVLPLAQGQAPGARAVGADGTVDAAGSLGEASASCAEGKGEGILPGTVSWITLDLAPGHYELLCDVPGHYSAGMWAGLTVT